MKPPERRRASLDILRRAGRAGGVVPAPHDPDSFIKANGGDAFRQLVENADGFLTITERLCKLEDVNTDKAGTPFCAAWPGVHKRQQRAD